LNRKFEIIVKPIKQKERRKNERTYLHDRSNLLINIVLAVVGAFLAGYFLSPLFGIGTINDAITLPTMLVTLLGAIILIAIVRLFRRGR